MQEQQSRKFFEKASVFYIIYELIVCDYDYDMSAVIKLRLSFAETAFFGRVKRAVLYFKIAAALSRCEPYHCRKREIIAQQQSRGGGVVPSQRIAK